MKTLAAAALAGLAVVALGVSYRAAGVTFKEPLTTVCYEKAPAGWYEGTHAEARWTHVPPRTRCQMVNRWTGETATWDSGFASLPWFLVAALAGLGALAVTAWGGVACVSRLVARDG